MTLSIIFEMAGRIEIGGEDQRPDPGDGGKRASGLINPFQVSDVSGVGFQRISP